MNSTAGRPAAIRPRRADAASRMRSHAGDAARLLKALAHDQRLLVLCLLSEGGELSVGEINKRVALSQSALSQHLARLRADGLVTTRRDGQTIRYALAEGPARAVVAALHAAYCPTR